MQAEIISRKENPLLKRIEIQFKVVHHGEGTPQRDTIKEEIAKLAKAPTDRVVIDHMESQFGTTQTLGYAKIYDSKEDALAFERKHILGRNKLIVLEAKKKVKKVEAYKPVKVEEAPAEESEEKPEKEPEAEKEEPKEAPEAKEEGE
ncbi:MAG: 30S ribosomal protein S24e [Thermoplasmata archaeon]